MLSKQQTFSALEEAQRGCVKAKTLLIEQNSPLIKSIIKRYLNKGVEYDDLYQLGMMGLIKAINNFDLSYDVQFSTYAVPMIAGEVKRFLRDDGSIKVSRSVKAQYQLINRYIEKYVSKNQKSPSVTEIAKEFNIEEHDVVYALESNKKPAYLYQKADDGEKSQTLADKVVTEDNFDKELDKIILKNLILKLSERERKIIMLRFYRDKTQSEVAKVLGISQVQISRIENKVLADMKKEFEK